MPNFMPIPGDSDDLRAVRTRGEIASALIGLTLEKGFDEISVQEICEKAGVGRSTFYAHFKDKDDLFIRHTVVFGRALGRHLAWDEALGSYRFPARGLFEHVRQMKPLFDSLARARKTEFIMKVWHNNIAEAFEQRILAVRAGGSTATEIPAEILAQQLAGTLRTLMVWWMDYHYPLAEEAMEKQFQRLIAGLS
ncbi:MAG TPA: TetR/AcrR family transcriptional regulator [Steroidobacteraceae bacterium]